MIAGKVERARASMPRRAWICAWMKHSIGMSEHPGGDCAGGGARERPIFAARSAGVRRGRPVPGGQGASRWMLPGGQRGPSAAVLARVRGGRIKVAWRRARELERLRRRHQLLPGGAGQMPRCRVRRRPRPPLVRAPCPLMPATGSGRDAIPGPAADDRPVPAAVAPGHRRAEGRDPPVARLPHARAAGTRAWFGRGRHPRFHRHGQAAAAQAPAACCAGPAAIRSRSCGDGPSGLGQSGAVSCLTVPLPVRACPALGYEGARDLTGCPGHPRSCRHGLAGVPSHPMESSPTRMSRRDSCWREGSRGRTSHWCES